MSATALLSRFIFVHSELSSENQLTDMTCVLFTILTPSNTIPDIIPLDSIPRESPTSNHYQPVAFPTFCLCLSLWHLWPLDNPLDSPSFSYFFLGLSLKVHSWTMTCSDCLCPCYCLHCSLVEICSIALATSIARI